MCRKKYSTGLTVLSYVQIMSSEKGPVVAPMITTAVGQARQVNKFHYNKRCNLRQSSKKIRRLLS